MVAVIKSFLSNKSTNWNTIFLRLPSFIYSYVFSVLSNRFFFFTRFCFISVALPVSTDRNVLPEGLKFRILFRGQLIWKRHLSNSLKKLNPSILKFSGHWTTVRSRLCRDLYRIWPLKFSDYRISIYGCIFKSFYYTGGENLKNARTIVGVVFNFYFSFWYKHFQRVTDRSNFRKQQKRTVYFLKIFLPSSETGNFS